MFTRNSLSPMRFGMLIIGMLGMLIFSVAEADQPTTVQTADGDAQPKQQESLDVRYARAHVKLANLDFLRFLEAQRRSPAVLPIEAGADLKRHVAIDEEQLKQAAKGPDGNLHEIYIRSAKISVELAKRDLKRKQQAYEEFSSETQAFELERAEAVVELAQLHLEMTMTKKSALSSMTYLQWQIDVLRNQVLELQVQLKSESRRN